MTEWVSIHPFIFGQQTTYGRASYVLTLNIGDPETESTLTNLTSANATLSPAFASGTTNYSATIPLTQTSINLTPRWSSELIHTTMKVNGDASFAIGNGGYFTPQMPPGTNTVVFKVCAQNGAMTIYTVTVVRGEPIGVEPPNDPPSASDANYIRGPRQSLKILIADLIANNTSDPEGDARSLTSLGSPTGGGAVSQSGG